jgi:hypothetical protein
MQEPHCSLVDTTRDKVELVMKEGVSKKTPNSQLDPSKKAKLGFSCHKVRE